MFILLGGSGYVGMAFARYLTSHGIPFRNLRRAEHDYAQLDGLRNLLRETKPTFLINCAGYTGKPNVDACELHKSECLFGNAVLPGIIRQACEDTATPWGHISSGCIYSGSPQRSAVSGTGLTADHADSADQPKPLTLNPQPSTVQSPSCALVSDPALKQTEGLKSSSQSPVSISQSPSFRSTLNPQPSTINSPAAGFTEADPPNFTFRQNNCSFYSGTKALGEEVLAGASNCYIWRLRIPFNEADNPRNYLTKVMRYDRLLEAQNSLSQLDEFVRAAFDCWQKRVQFGIYNVTNPGFVTTREVVELIQQSGLIKKQFQFFKDEDEFMDLAAKTPRSNCVLDTTKLQKTGIKMTEVHEAIEQSLRHWQFSG